MLKKYSAHSLRRILRNWFNAQNFPPIILPLIISFAIWWNPNFFIPDTYINWGDILFPMQPFQYLWNSRYTWITGSYAQYWLGYRALAFLVAGFSYIGIPLWVVNRLYLILPTAMLGWFTYYLYTSLFSGCYRRHAGIVASTFIMLAPIFTGNIHYDFAIACFPLMLGSLIRGLNAKKVWFKYAFLVCLGSIVMATEPRTAYMGFMVVILCLILVFSFDRSLFNFGSVKFILCSLVMSLLVNLYWILPLLHFYMQQNLKEMALVVAPHAGLSKLLFYKDSVGPVWIMRLIVSPLRSPLSQYFNLPFITIFSFLIPVYAYFSLLVVKDKRLYLMAMVALILTFFGMALSFEPTFNFYMFLYNYVPGFFIVDNPHLWLMFLRIFYAILVGVTLQASFSKINTLEFNQKFTPTLARDFKILLLSGLLVLLSINGCDLLIYNSPIHNAAGGRLPNHTPSMKIPSAYYDMEAYILKYVSGEDRIFNLPLVPYGYVAYSWWHDFTMPEIVASLSPVPVMGITAYPSEVERKILTSITNGEVDSAAYFMGRLGVKFVIVHKDYYPLPIVGFLPADYIPYLRNLSNSSFFTEVMSNEYFTLYQLNTDLRYPSLIRILAGSPTSSLSLIKNYDFRMISPTEYKIRVNSTSPFYLILNEKFDPEWVAYVDGREVDNHTKTNEGWNKWYISQAGYIDIVLRFKPQTIAELGESISIISFLVILVLICADFFRPNWLYLIQLKLKGWRRCLACG